MSYMIGEKRKKEKLKCHLAKSKVYMRMQLHAPHDTNSVLKAINSCFPPHYFSKQIHLPLSQILLISFI